MSTWGCHSIGARRKSAIQSLARICGSIALCLLFAVGQVLAAPLERRITLDIPVNTPLDEALGEVSAKIGMHVSSATSSLENRKTRGLRGTFTAKDALTTLLEEFHLSYTVDGDRLWVVRGEKDTVRHQKPAASGNSVQKMEEVVVTTTGTHIRGGRRTAPMNVLERRDFEHYGFQTVGELIRSLPQAFNGGLNLGVISAGGAQNTTAQSGASTANLRGLGSASTLTLINGHRIASAEGSGAADLTLIPLTAVERIEIVTDGASAIYGSDAVAGVVNIILREDYEAVQLGGTVGGATAGGGFLQQYNAVAGTSWEGGHGFATADCARQSDIESGQRAFIPRSIAGTTLVPQTRRCSFMLNATQAIAHDGEVSLQGLYTKRSSDQWDNLNSQSQGLAAGTTAQVTQYTVNANLALPLSESWGGVVSAGASADSVTAPQVLTMDGAFHAAEGDIFDNRLRSLEARADGTLFRRPAGPVKLALGAGYREETFDFANLPQGQFAISRRRGVSFVFAEALVPLIAAAEGTDDLHSLTGTLAGRSEHYSDVGSTTNPKIGLLYVPFRDLRLRASWSTSFRAPSLLQQYNSSQANLETVTDAAAPGGESLVLLRFGGHQQLQPEQSSTFSLAMDLTPVEWPGASFQLAYYDIRYKKRIEYPTANTGDPLSDPNVWPFTTRNPSTALIREIIQQSQYADLTGGKYDPTAATAIVDDRYQNISQQRASGVDLQSGYQRKTELGEFNGSLNLAYLDLQQRVTGTSALLHLSGNVFYPPTYRGRLNVSWENLGYSASTALNYIGPSRDADSMPPQRISAWTTVDAQLGYMTQQHGPWGKTRLTLSAQNLFNRRPPLVNVDQAGSPGVNFDSTNTSAIGRFVTFQVTNTW